MITGRNPWDKASMKDEDFAQFINNPDYFYDTFPLSKGACDILIDTFTLNPMQRISLRSLREAVMNLKTFFRSQEEMDFVTGIPTVEETETPEIPPANLGEKIFDIVF